MYASLVCSFRFFSSLICVWGKGAIDSCWKWKPRASLVAQMVKKKNPPAMQETQVRSLGWEDPLEKGMATSHASILAWRIPWTEQLGRPQSVGTILP